ncbi:MAG: hypothetical protein CVU98_05830 [Firmicutes bacterium HGW-Firmicutes-3]|jgi:thiosulfate/3-mercaptopyruvate sulfurtransferase|nr:MAG: hypothetical protein CVU98_05830 [Firmicutes bacterium HGW-Firmicutes-3]
MVMTITTRRLITVVGTIILMMSFVGCNKTSYDQNENIIEAGLLKERLSDAKTIVIDARSKEDYEKGHMIGAIHLAPEALTVSEPIPGLIAPKELVETVLSSKGIKNDSKVYIYDNKEGIYAARLWWVLKVYGHQDVKVINNGEKAIVQNGFELTLDVPIINPSTYEAAPVDESIIATMDEVLRVVEGETEGIIIDTRSVAEYDEGAVPGAILFPHTKNLYTDGSFKSPRDIYLDYNDLGVKRDDAIILYCKSSVRATQTAILLKEAGFKNVKVYDGAWLEWSTKDTPTTEKSEEVVPSTQDAS